MYFSKDILLPFHL